MSNGEDAYFSSMSKLFNYICEYSCKLFSMMLTGNLKTQVHGVFGVLLEYYRNFSLGQCAGLRASVVVTRDIFRVSGFNVVITDNYFQVSISERRLPSSPFHTAKLCIVGLPVIVLCMLIFKPFLYMFNNV